MKARVSWVLQVCLGFIIFLFCIWSLRERALFLALRLENSLFVHVLLAMGTDPNSVDKDGLPALTRAVMAETASLKMTEALLGYSANPNKSDFNGVAPLHEAIFLKKVNTVKILLRAGADPNALTLDGSTPLFFAAYHGNHEILDLVIANGGKILGKNKAGQSAIDVAKNNGDNKTVERLVGLGVTPPNGF